MAGIISLLACYSTLQVDLTRGRIRYCVFRNNTRNEWPLAPYRISTISSRISGLFSFTLLTTSLPCSSRSKPELAHIYLPPPLLENLVITFQKKLKRSIPKIYYQTGSSAQLTRYHLTTHRTPTSYIYRNPIQQYIFYYLL